MFRCNKEARIIQLLARLSTKFLDSCSIEKLNYYAVSVALSGRLISKRSAFYRVLRNRQQEHFPIHNSSALLG